MSQNINSFFAALTPNTEKLGVFVITLFGFVFLAKLSERFLINRLSKLAKHTKTDIDDTLLAMIRSIKPPFYLLIGLYLGFRFIELNSNISRIVEITTIAWATYQAVLALQILIDYAFEKYSSKEKNSGTKEALKTLAKILKGILWVVGFLFLLQNLGINVTSLMAGLGIGGIAIALAAQNILGDLFSSFSILFDKPFVPGDFIVVGDYMGTVEKIGIKTTRLTSLQGEQLIIPNVALTSEKIQNYKRMSTRRVQFDIGVNYATPQSKVKKIPNIVKTVVKEVKGAKFDRTHFSQFGDSALIFTVVYIAQTADYNKYMDINEQILLGIKKHFESENIEFAYPSQTIYLAK